MRPLVVLGALPLFLACGHAKERQAIEADLAAAQAGAAERTAGFDAAMATRANVKPGAGECPLAPRRDPPRPGSNEEKLAGQIGQIQAAMARAGGDSNAVIVRAGTPLRAPHAAMLERRIKTERDDLPTGDLEPLAKRAKELADPAFWGQDLVVDIDEQKDTGSVDPAKKSFTGGAAHGRSYLYDYRTKAIACAGEFQAENAENVEYMATPGQQRTAAGGAVLNDLNAQILKAARAALRARD